MNKSQKLRTLGIFLLILICALIIKNQIKDEKVEVSDEKKTPSTVECSPVKLKKISPIIDFSGRINSVNKINIISEVNGVSEIYNSKFEVGEEFKKGEVLISIKDDDIELELKSIKSQFLALLVQVLPDIKMDFPSLGNKFQTYVNNFRLDGKISNLPSVKNSKQRNFLSSRQVFANYYTIKALENKLDKFKIKAPFDGIVTKTLIDIGSNIIVGQPLGEFINPNNYEISTSVSVKESKLITVGNRVVISSDDLIDQVGGVVKRVGNHINELTQSIDVFVSINGDDLKDGMYGSGKILCDTISGVYKVERAKISQENSIYLLEDKTLRLKSIDIIVFQDDSVIIKGVNNNECIVNQYRHYFHDGMQIN